MFDPSGQAADPPLVGVNPHLLRGLPEDPSGLTAESYDQCCGPSDLHS